jgi:hypothetical protein
VSLNVIRLHTKSLENAFAPIKNTQKATSVVIVRNIEESALQQTNENIVSDTVSIKKMANVFVAKKTTLIVRKIEFLEIQYVRDAQQKTTANAAGQTSQPVATKIVHVVVSLVRPLRMGFVTAQIIVSAHAQSDLYLMILESAFVPKEKYR